MALTTERASELTNILTSDPERGKELLAMSPEEALKHINGGLGKNFTTSEIEEYGKALSQSLSDDALSGVAGGAGADMEEQFLATVATVVGIIYVGTKAADNVIGWFRN